MMPEIARQLKDDGWDANDISNEEREELLQSLDTARSPAPSLMSRKAVDVHREKGIRAVVDEVSTFCCADKYSFSLIHRSSASTHELASNIYSS